MLVKENREQRNFNLMYMLQSMLAVFTVIIACSSVCATRNQYQFNKNQSIYNENFFRPFVTVETIIGLDTRGKLQYSIANYGGTPALHVQCHSKAYNSQDSLLVYERFDRYDTYSSLVPNGNYNMYTDMKNIVGQIYCFLNICIYYEDIKGKGYWTTTIIGQNELEKGRYDFQFLRSEMCVSPFMVKDYEDDTLNSKQIKRTESKTPADSTKIDRFLQ